MPIPVPPSSRDRALPRRLLAILLPLLAACGETAGPVASPPVMPGNGTAVAVALACSASVTEGTVTCEQSAADASPAGARHDLRTVGGQGLYVRTTFTNPTRADGVLAFDATVQNLSSLAMGTVDGTTPDVAGVRVFFASPPTATEGAGTVTVANADGADIFLGSGQPYFQYGGSAGGSAFPELGGDGVLTSAEVTTAKPWRFLVPAGVTRFVFTVYVRAQTPAGTLASVAPQVTSVSPATLVPGTTATLTGSNFLAPGVGNTVRIGGALATVTAAAPTQLQVTVPCVPSGDVAVSATHTGMTGRRVSAPLRVRRHALAPGGTVIVADAPDVGCNELAPAGGTARYVVAVYNTSTSPADNAPVSLSSGDALPAVTAAPFHGAAPHGPPVRVETPEASHSRLLEQNAVEYERLRTRFAGDARLRPSRSLAADLVEPPLTRRVRVPRIDVRSYCSTYTEINVRRVYHAGRIAIYEDTDSTPAALRSQNSAAMADYYRRIGDQFNADMEPVVWTHFGDVLRRDAVTDNNGVLVAVFTPVINRRHPGVAGFIVSCDLFPNDSTAATPTNSSSNFGEYFYAYQPTDSTGATGYATFTPDSWYWSIRATFIHETKHVASYVARAANRAPFEAAWLEEGTARHSEELWARSAVYGVPWKANTGYGSAAAPGSIYCDWRREAAVDGGAACLATNPRRPSLNVYRHFSSLYNFMSNGRFLSAFGATPDDRSATWYATSWSLARYAIDRYGASDAAFLTALTGATETGTANLAARAGVPLAQLMGEWALALAIDDYPGMPVAATTPQFPTWNHRDIYAGMNADPLLGFPQPWPIRFTGKLALGAVAPLDVPTLRGGGVAWIELSGSHTAPQLLRLQGGTAAAPTALPSTVRVAIARVE